MGGQGRIKGSHNLSSRIPSIRIGEIHGAWKILDHEGLRYSKNGKHSYHYWICQCQFCGKTMARSTHSVKGTKNGKGNGCDCLLVVPDASFHRAYRTYKRQGRVRGLAFEIPLEEFKKLVVQNCSYCGQEPALNSYSEDSKIRVPMNGIDRKNSKLPYTLENCIPACGTCNKAKLDYSEQDFLKWVNRTAVFQIDRLIKSTSKTPGICIEGVSKPDEEFELEEEP